MRMQFTPQGRRPMPAAGRLVTTNDVGEFHLFGLPPGEYLVAATLHDRFDGPPGATTIAPATRQPTIPARRTSARRRW